MIIAVPLVVVVNLSSSLVIVISSLVNVMLVIN